MAPSLLLMTLLASPPHVLELFTSEGCSSCPPADALLERTAVRDDVIVLSFHVDYWNDLGWADPYSDEASTERQRRYSARLARGRTYTPQLVVDGETEFVGSDGARLREALARKIEKRTEVKITRARKQGEEVDVQVQSSSREPLTVLLVQRAAQGKVTRGENAGVTLRHVNVVRALRTLPPGNGTVRLPLPPGGHAFSVVILAQAEDSLRIDGAAIRSVD